MVRRLGLNILIPGPLDYRNGISPDFEFTIQRLDVRYLDPRYTWQATIIVARNQYRITCFKFNLVGQPLRFSLEAVCLFQVPHSQSSLMFVTLVFGKLLLRN